MLNLFLFSLEQPKLLAVSNVIAFLNPNAPLYPRLAQGKEWNEVSSYLISTSCYAGATFCGSEEDRLFSTLCSSFP